jgi:hypothetical protein
MDAQVNDAATPVIRGITSGNGIPKIPRDIREATRRNSASVQDLKFGNEFSALLVLLVHGGADGETRTPNRSSDGEVRASGRRWSSGRGDGPRRKAWPSARRSCWRVPAADRIRRFATELRVTRQTSALASPLRREAPGRARRRDPSGDAAPTHGYPGGTKSLHYRHA